MAFDPIGISEIKPVCGKDCPDRSWDCHKQCEKYKAYRAECDKAMHDRFMENQHKHDTNAAVLRSIKKMRGKRRF